MRCGGGKLVDFTLGLGGALALDGLLLREGDLLAGGEAVTPHAARLLLIGFASPLAVGHLLLLLLLDKLDLLLKGSHLGQLLLSYLLLLSLVLLSPLQLLHSGGILLLNGNDFFLSWCWCFALAQPETLEELLLLSLQGSLACVLPLGLLSPLLHLVEPAAHVFELEVSPCLGVSVLLTLVVAVVDAFVVDHILAALASSILARWLLAAVVFVFL